ncbi:hypothetical protein AB0F52_10435 [Amycolatopsis sp. NPDC024027]|uniref:hypothetical protein n=1 Tax=Amycolatopsis sp. NPDC024027 TaxID=3154327 RepID=UPI0033CB7865
MALAAEPPGRLRHHGPDRTGGTVRENALLRLQTTVLKAEGHSHSAETKPDACPSTTTSLIAGVGSGRSASVIPAASAA